MSACFRHTGHEDDAVPGGHVYADLALTRVVIAAQEPHEWERVAAFLRGLLARAPLKEGSGYAAERMVLGALADELTGYARAAGEPIGLERDLANAKSRREGQAIRERMRLADEAFVAHVERTLDAAA